MTRALRLSVVDQSPIHDGGPATRAPHDSLRLAQACERAGYHRYWVAEHHATPGYAGPCPEILVGHIAAHTQRIRVGSGGVMLPHYSPFKVAEVFRMLAVLYPERIDLGLGRAPGGDSLATAALAFPREPIDPRLYPRQVYDLMGHLYGDLPEDHPFHAVPAVPEGPAPEVWLLGSSGGSAELAGQLGAGLALALFIGTHERSPAIVEAYRRAFRPSPGLETPRWLIAVAAVAAPSREEAWAIAASRSLWLTRVLSQGELTGIEPPEAALAAAEGLPPRARAIFDASMAQTVIGTPQDCAERLHALATEYDTGEVSLVNVCYHFEHRVRSYELIARACGLAA